MGIRIVYDPEDNRTALYDSVTGAAFGPVIEPTDDDRFGSTAGVANSFLDACDEAGLDPRVLSHDMLVELLAAHRAGREFKVADVDAPVTPGWSRHVVPVAGQ